MEAKPMKKNLPLLLKRKDVDKNLKQNTGD